MKPFQSHHCQWSNFSIAGPISHQIVRVNTFWINYIIPLVTSKDLWDTVVGQVRGKERLQQEGQLLRGNWKNKKKDIWLWLLFSNEKIKCNVHNIHRILLIVSDWAGYKVQGDAGAKEFHEHRPPYCIFVP